MPIPKGTVVHQIIPVISGTVVATKFNDDVNAFEYCVEFLNADGEVSQRWFNENEVEVSA